MQASKKPTASKVKPTLPAPVKPSSSQPEPIANAWPGPREKPMAARKPKLGNSVGISVQISTKVKRKTANL